MPRCSGGRRAEPARRADRDRTARRGVRRRDARRAGRGARSCLAARRRPRHHRPDDAAARNGLELARQLRRDAIPELRVVLTSAYHLSERQLERADCGAVGFVPKPLDLSELAQFLRARLRPPFARLPAKRTASGSRPHPVAGDGSAAVVARRACASTRFTTSSPPSSSPQRPGRSASGARLLRRSPATGALEHRCDREARRTWSRPDALVVVNDTRVMPARLLGTQARDRRPGRGASSSAASAYARGRGGERAVDARDLASARQVEQAAPLRRRRRDRAPRREPRRAGALVVRLLGRATDDGCLEVALCTRGPASPSTTRSARCGHVPLPPYIKRDDEPEDAERYQTVFARARRRGRRADRGPAPHAARSSSASRRAAARSPRVTLHVGLGTFQPVHRRRSRRPPDARRALRRSRAPTADAIARARARGAPVVAVGTTVVRALESGGRSRPTRATSARRAARRASSSSPAIASASSTGCSRTSTCPSRRSSRSSCAFGGTRARARRVPTRPCASATASSPTATRCCSRERRDEPRRRRRASRSASSRDDGARAARPSSTTPHGDVETPTFMPVGTQGSVKTLIAGRGRGDGRAHRPRQHVPPVAAPRRRRRSRALGGLHGFTRWPHAMLTDSGGFQAFSLAARGEAIARRARARTASRSGRTSTARSTRSRPRIAVRVQGLHRRGHRDAARRVPAGRVAARRWSRRPSRGRRAGRGARCLAAARAAGALRDRAGRMLRRSPPGARRGARRARPSTASRSAASPSASRSSACTRRSTRSPPRSTPSARAT